MVEVWVPGDVCQLMIFEDVGRGPLPERTGPDAPEPDPPEPDPEPEAVQLHGGFAGAPAPICTMPRDLFEVPTRPGGSGRDLEHQFRGQSRRPKHGRSSQMRALGAHVQENSRLIELGAGHDHSYDKV